MLGPSSWRIGCVGGDGHRRTGGSCLGLGARAGASRSYGAGEDRADAPPDDLVDLRAVVRLTTSTSPTTHLHFTRHLYCSRAITRAISPSYHP